MTRLFKLKIFLHALYLSLRLRKHVKVQWWVANLVLRRGGYCPCRFVKEKCPCRWRVEELKKYGRCRCGLFVT